MNRDPLGIVSRMEVLAGSEVTHVLCRQSDDIVLFRGTKTQCEWVKQGYDNDLRTNHPDNQGETYIEEATE